MTAPYITIEQLHRNLGGDVCANRRRLNCPGPGHSHRDRSLSILLDPGAPVLVYSHCGDDWRDCREYVRDRLGLPRWQPGDERRRTIPAEHIEKWDLGSIEMETGPRMWNEDELIRISFASRIWDEASDPRETLAEKYLCEFRKLDLPDSLAGAVLRFHPQCPWRDENTGKNIRVPALIAAFRSIDDDSITAVHRIA